MSLLDTPLTRQGGLGIEVPLICGEIGRAHV